MPPDPGSGKVRSCGRSWWAFHASVWTTGAVVVECWVTHLDFILVVVALDDAELTGRDWLPIVALAEFGVVWDLNSAAHVVHLDAEILELLVPLNVPVEVIGVARCLWLPWRALRIASYLSTDRKATLEVGERVLCVVGMMPYGCMM